MKKKKKIIVEEDFEEFASYRSSSTLKKAGVQINWTPEMIEEYQRCADSPIYFSDGYIKAITLDEGLKNITLRDYQRELVTSCAERRYTIAEMSRQSGKTTAVCAFVLWYIIFQADKSVAILANKAEVAQEIISRVQLAYESLPKWLQQGVLFWNKRSFALENNSRVLASATSSKAIRGFSVNALIIDECAHIDKWDEFFTSVFPTITAGTTSKIIMISSVYGLNHFYKFTSLARQKKNDYNLISVSWQRVPGRDNKWRENELAQMNFDTDRFAQEYENEYLGSSGTLIAGWKLKELVAKIPITAHEGLRQYIKPIEDHKYVMSVDVSHGANQDYSAFSVIDVTTGTFVQVCTYKNNKITPVDYCAVINYTGKLYNEALVMVETNDIGEHVSYVLFEDYEYDNLVRTMSDGLNSRKTTLGFGAGTKRIEKGVRTTKKVKIIGCSMLKLLIEQDRLIVHDESTIFELATFSRKGETRPATYEAENGQNDDLVIGLVLFAWLTEQDQFKNFCDINTLQEMRQKSDLQMSEELATFIMNDGSDPNRDFYIDGDLDPTSEKFNSMFNSNEISPFKFN